MNQTKNKADENGCLHWCISLERRKDRRFVIKRTFPESIADLVHFFDATDGSKIPDWKISSRKYAGATRSSYAVRLSKSLLLRKFLRQDLPYVCMYEDDVVLDGDFSKILNHAIQNVPSDWDCLFLGGSHECSPTGTGDFRRCRDTYNNHCLLFNRAGAAKVLSLLIKKPYRFGWSDREIAGAIKDGKLNGYCLAKFVAHQRRTSSDNFVNGHREVTIYNRKFSPWMLPDDAHVLYAAARPGDTVVEWGSSGSTLVFAQRVGDSGKVVSVEYQQGWFDKVNRQLQSHDLAHRANVIYEPPNPQREQDSPFQLLPKQMDGYVRSPVLKGGVQPGSVDVVFVDGRQRLRCALFAAKLLRSGGFLMIHDFWCRVASRIDLGWQNC